MLLLKQETLSEYLCLLVHPSYSKARSRIPHPAALTAKTGNTGKDRTPRCYPKPEPSAPQHKYLLVQVLSTAGFGGCEDVPDRGDGCRGLLPQLGLPSLHALRTCTSNSVWGDLSGVDEVLGTQS